jgi:hypothetical protein
MDNVEKVRVMLQHWIDHNKGHVDDFEKWRKTMADDGQDALAGHITEAVKLMADVNASLGKALHAAGGSQGGNHGHKPHTHDHKHTHSHGHNHDHDHDHDHNKKAK